MSRRDHRARMTGYGETALAAIEDAKSKIRLMGPATIEPGKWALNETYFTSAEVKEIDLFLFEVEASFEWVPETDDEEPF